MSRPVGTRGPVARGAELLGDCGAVLRADVDADERGWIAEGKGADPAFGPERSVALDRTASMPPATSSPVEARAMIARRSSSRPSAMAPASGWPERRDESDQ